MAWPIRVAVVPSRLFLFLVPPRISLAPIVSTIFKLDFLAMVTLIDIRSQPKTFFSSPRCDPRPDCDLHRIGKGITPPRKERMASEKLISFHRGRVDRPGLPIDATFQAPTRGAMSRCLVGKAESDTPADRVFHEE